MMEVQPRKSIFSDDRKYRYTLWRKWGNDASQLWNGGNELLMKPPGTYVQFIGLNPSTADEKIDDPTLRRCIGFAKSWGYGEMCMTNLFAFRATDPNVMIAQEDPVGIQNNTEFINVAQKAGLVIACWGTIGLHRDRADWVKKMMFDIGVKLKCFGLTKTTKQPKHPLYLRADSALIDY